MRGPDQIREHGADGLIKFRPDGATEEVEEYALQLEDVSTIQLRIVPSIDGQPAVVRVSELRVASV